MTKWHEDYETLPFEAPLDLHDSARSLRMEARRIYTEYLDGKGSKASLDEFSKIVSQYDKVMEETQETMLRLSKERFACPKHVGKWLERNRHDTILRQIRRNGGIITRNEIDAITGGC